MEEKEAVKAAASITGKSTLTKVIVGVITIALIGTGAVGIHSIKKEDETRKKQEKIATEQEPSVHNITLDDLIGGYVNDEYLLEFSYSDGNLFVYSGIIPGKEMFSHAYGEVQVDGNTIKATYKDFDDLERIDTFVLHDDGTLTATFEGIKEIRSGSYERYSGDGSVFDVAIESSNEESYIN